MKSTRPLDAPGAVRSPVEDQRTRGDLRPALEHHGALDDVAQLAHVSRPGVGEEAVLGLAVEAVEAPAELGLQRRQEVAGERQDVLAGARAAPTT